MSLQPHQQRVVDEHRELNDKITKLISFTDSERFKSIDVEERNLLLAQLNFMVGYRTILDRRIARWQ